ncbi:PAS domain S-box protein (plasmid) [Deinococcus radiomollis]|uniref:PAS domain S-box protein n=1 Tax=Deinococcus radiomollis TaxID=468916 RepID=UPI0038928614
MTSQPSPDLGSFEALAENLQGITEALAATTTQRDVIEIVLTPAVRALGATAGIVLLVDETDQQMKIAGSQGYEDGVPTLWQEGPIAHHMLIADILHMGVARYFEEAGELKGAYPELEGRTGRLLPVANATLPMFLDNQPLGVIVLDFTEPHHFTRAERRFLTILSGQCAVALGRAEAIRTLEARVEERTRQLEEEQRARAEEARVASEDRYRQLFDSIDEGLATVEVLFDVDGKAVDYRFLEVNLAHEKMTGIPRTVVGQRVRELMPTFEQNGIDRVARVALTGEPVRYEEHVSALGRWFDVSSTRVGGKDSRVVANVLNDITQRKRVEEELRVSEERFRLFVTASSDTVYRMSADWSNMQSLVGRGFLSDTHGSSLTWQEEYIPAGEKAFVRAAIDEAIRGRTVFELEHRIVRADGTVGWALSRAVPLLNERGEIVEWFGAATDITGRKHWEVRQAFLLKLADVLGPLADPVAIQDAVTREVMETFGADRCYYCEILGDSAVIRRDAARGTLPSVAGTYTLSSFALFKAAVEAGRPLIVHDVHTSDLVDDELKQLCLGLQAISFIDIPVMKHGRAVGMLCLVQSSPRHWTDLEVELAAETAERTWAAVERARVEEALRESELRRELAIDAAGLGTYVWYVQEDRPETDVRLLELLGVQGAGEVSLANALVNVIHPDDRDRYAAEATRALDPDGDGKLDIEARFVQPGGAVKWIALSGQTVFEGEPRQAVRMYGTVADITERKQAEEHQVFLLDLSDALRAEQGADGVANRALGMLAEHLQLDRASIGVYHLGEDRGEFTHQVGNDRVPPLPSRVRLSDVPDALHVSLDSTLVIDDVARDERLSEVDRQNLGGLGVGALVAAALRKGEHRPLWSIVALSARPRRWTSGETALINEVAERTWAATERVQAENAVQASREQLRAVANLVPDLLWESEPDGETTWYNGRWLEYTGQSFEQAVGWGWLDAIHPDDRDASTRRYQESVTAGQPLRQEHRIRRQDGEYRWFAVDTAPVLGQRGQVIRVYGSATDIHDLRTLNTELEVRVEDRTQRLTDLNGELRTLATASSEEINEPLRRLRGFLHLLEGRIAQHLDEKTRRYFDLVQGEAERAERMAEDFKALSSLEHRELKPTLVPLVTLVLQVRTDLAPRLIGQTAEWTVGSLPVVTGDAMLLRQAFTELLHHNLRLVPEGIKAQIEVNPTAVDGQTAILVDVWPVRATAADLQGDGLATARRVVQRHGGTLEAELQGEHLRILLKLPDRRS